MSSAAPSANLLVRVISVSLVVCLLSSATPSAPQTIVTLAKESSISFLFWFHSSSSRKLIQGNGPVIRKKGSGL